MQNTHLHKIKIFVTPRFLIGLSYDMYLSKEKDYNSLNTLVISNLSKIKNSNRIYMYLKSKNEAEFIVIVFVYSKIIYIVSTSFYILPWVTKTLFLLTQTEHTDIMSNILLHSLLLSLHNSRSTNSGDDV